jgi:anti-sigma regulatory factor (Ser/Thr protein kinase)
LDDVWVPSDAEYRRLEALQPALRVNMTLSVDIPRDPMAPAAARRAIEALSGRVADDVIPDVKLLVSELITNSVKYGGEGALRLQIETEGSRKLRAEVIDQGVGFVPVARDRPATDVGGWGLHLVQTLSNRWGVHEGSTHVWFEIDR